jgi:hypothetical protein
MLLAGVAVTEDCSQPTYTNLTWTRPPTNALQCSGVIETSTYANTALPMPWLPAVPPGDGAYKWVGDAILVSSSPGQMCRTHCSDPIITIPTGGTPGQVFSVTKTRTQSTGFNYGLLGPLFNYLAGPSWTSSSTFGVVCASSTTITPPLMNIVSGQRRAFAIYAHTLKYYEKRSSGTTSGWREETYQFPNFHEGGVGNYNATYDFCAGTWSSATCAKLTPCTATIEPTVTF